MSDMLQEIKDKKEVELALQRYDKRLEANFSGTSKDGKAYVWLRDYSNLHPFIVKCALFLAEEKAKTFSPAVHDMMMQDLCIIARKLKEAWNEHRAGEVGWQNAFYNLNTEISQNRDMHLAWLVFASSYTQISILMPVYLSVLGHLGTDITELEIEDRILFSVLSAILTSRQTASLVGKLKRANIGALKDYTEIIEHKMNKRRRFKITLLRRFSKWLYFCSSKLLEYTCDEQIIPKEEK